MTPDERIAAELVAEAKRRYGPTRDIELSHVGGALEIHWWRTIVEVPTDPERELSLAEARAIADTEWAVGDSVGMRLEPWW